MSCMRKIGFIGCHEISWHCLKKICELTKQTDDFVSIVFNLDDKEASKHSATTNFRSLSDEYGFELHNVSNVSDLENIEILSKYNLDILFIIGWHRIVPQSVLDTAKICLGIHSSILPRDRGSSPINWQIIRGHTKGGITLFHLTEGIDSGDIVDTKRYEIDIKETIKDVYSKATIASLDLLEKNWNDIHSMQPKSIPQDDKSATFNERRRPSDGIIDWNWDATKCYNWIRALTKPYPGAFTNWKNKRVFLWDSRISQKTTSEPGKIIEVGKKIVVSTGNGCIEITSLQVEDEPICDAELFSKSYGISVDEVFEK